MDYLHERLNVVAAVRGHGWPLYLVGTAFMLLAVSVPTVSAWRGEPLAWEMVRQVWGTIGCFTGVLFLVGLQQSRRRIYLGEDGRIQITGPLWLGRTFDVAEVTDVTWHEEIAVDTEGGSSQTYATFWRDRHRLARVNVMFWNRTDMAQLFQTIVAMNANVQLGPRARDLVASVQESAVQSSHA